MILKPISQAVTPSCCVKKVVLKNFAKFTRKQQWNNWLQAWVFLKRYSNTDVLLRIFAKFLRTLFTEHFRWLLIQFQAEIGSNAAISNAMKSSYLKELTVSFVYRRTANYNSGLPERKNILQTKFGETSVIVKSLVEHITRLPVVFGKNPVKVCEFYVKLGVTLYKLRKPWENYEKSMV